MNVETIQITPELLTLLSEFDEFGEFHMLFQMVVAHRDPNLSRF